MKDIVEVTYFLEIELDRSRKGIFLSQRKFVNDLLKEYHLENCKTTKLCMDTHVKLTSDSYIYGINCL